jgi:hypothetical protein
MISGVAGKNHRFLFNVTWWFWQVAIWTVVYLASPFSRDSFISSYWFWLFFGFLFAVFLVIQAFFHWRILMRYFPGQRRSNIGWTIGMPFYVFFGFNLIRVVMVVMVASQL